MIVDGQRNGFVVRRALVLLTNVFVDLFHQLRQGPPRTVHGVAGQIQPYCDILGPSVALRAADPAKVVDRHFDRRLKR